MKKANNEVELFAQKWKIEYKKILKKIKEYDRIAIFRHIIPDYDALGTQLGLAAWIKDNFPNKEVKVFGDNHVTFTPRLFPEMDNENEDWFKEPFLGIIVDVGNTSRIADPRYKKAKYKIKIDHHPDVEKYARISIVDTSAAAASEIVSNFIVSAGNEYFLSKEAANYLYIALVGDSGRFQYSSTSKHTFEIASRLLGTGIEISKIYQKMYLKQIDDLQVTAYILNHYSISEKGVAYYILDAKIQKDLKITTERGKENVNLFSNIEGIGIWCSVTEDPKDNCWRVSIRSKEKAINEVATKWRGGGHAQASGAKLENIDELPLLIKDLDNLL